MAEIRRVTEDFSVAPQLQPEDMADAARRGFKLVINNRPDGEAPGQPTSHEMEAAAKAAGLHYQFIPVRGSPVLTDVDAMHHAVKHAHGPVLAFCRSGTRSIVTWSLGQLEKGDIGRDELVRLAHGAGYDLTAVLS
ncbi:MAG TPA: TIGR01244 family sulfur transferase [Caulobacteraceae bacterium]|jgi:uncharacterized protein (TIGR01244 family)|nr:TIGR01244 family sulfur transferase [Caulobacteraceae bacterium]